VLQLAYLFQFTNVEVDLLLILLFKMLLLVVDAFDDLFSTLAHGCLYFVLELQTLLLECVFALFKCLHRFVHRVQLIQVGHCKLIQTHLRLLLYQLSEVLLGMLALLDLCFEYFFELVDFIECLGVALLLTLSLLQRFFLNLLLDAHVVVFETAQSGLQQD